MDTGTKKEPQGTKLYKKGKVLISQMLNLFGFYVCKDNKSRETYTTPTIGTLVKHNEYEAVYFYTQLHRHSRQLNVTVAQNRALSNHSEKVMEYVEYKTARQNAR